MKKYNTILVDDEFSALKTLEGKIEKFCPNLTITHTFQNSKKAIEAIKNTPPDILFLDVQMPLFDGFEVLEEIGEVASQIIFCTAFSEYALQALKKSAIDYILKPVDTNELVEAVQKAIHKIEKNNEHSPKQMLKLLHQILDKDQKISVSTQKGTYFVSLSEIIRLEGYDGYTKIYLQDQTMLISSYNLGKFKDKLNNYFFRCSKSHIVNLKFVRAFESDGYLLLSNHYRVPISRNHKQSLIEIFGS